MKKRRKRLDATPPALFDALRSIYREADALYAGHRCPGSTECCRFAITGREPYVTTIEVALVERARAALGGPLSPRRRALPIAADEHTCPLLNREGGCAIYADRPLGCRTFWCDRTDRDRVVRQRELNQLVRKVRELAERHQPTAVQGRPLRKALDA